MTTETVTEGRTLADVGRILVADADETFSGAVVQFLQWRGYHCDVARDLPTAERRLGTIDYDLVIADISMPETADLALTRRVRAVRVPVILVADRPSLASALAAVDLSVSAYLVKPIDFPGLLARVEAAMRAASIRRSLQAAAERIRRDLVARSLDASPHGVDAELPAFLLAALRTIVDGVGDITTLGEIVSETSGSVEPCGPNHCPRLLTALSAITETILVLESTKSAFKSRQLGELRGRLQSLLDEIHPTLASGLRARPR
jgi:DNA-binding response OmpR family regulator